MAWFKKDEKGGKRTQELSELPDLPPLPPTTDIPSLEFSKNPTVKQDLPPLPSFPASSTGDMISREAVKQAIREEPEDRKEFFIPTVKAPPKMVAEIEEGEEPEQLAPEFTPSFEPERIGIRERRASPKEPVYVRIDKYQSAMGDFQEIKDKLLEINNLLKDIKNLRAKEESRFRQCTRSDYPETGS